MWIIRNAQGEICGRFTNKPGPGNKMPDGSDEVPIYVEDDPAQPGFDAAKVAEVEAFATRPLPVPPKTIGSMTLEELKEALAKP